MEAPSDAANENRRKALEALEHLNALANDPHFTWFKEHVLNKARDEERAAALDARKTTDERDRACWRHDLAVRLCDKLEDLRALHATSVAIASPPRGES